MPKEQNSIRIFFWQALWLAGGIFFIWLWINNPVLMNYNLQLTALLAVLYFSSRFFFAPSLFLDTTILTLILLLVLAVTGGLNSPVFFLIYFLLFATALLFDPLFTLTLTLTLTLFFANTLNSTHAALQLFSLLLFTPLALWFGHKYLKLLEAQEKIKLLTQTKKTLLKESKKLDEALSAEENSSLLWLALNFKNTLLTIIHQTSNLLADNRLPLGKPGRDNLQTIYESAKALLKSGEKLMEKIDKETD